MRISLTTASQVDDAPAGSKEATYLNFCLELVPIAYGFGGASYHAVKDRSRP